jgi:hypothetical protein
MAGFFRDAAKRRGSGGLFFFVLPFGFVDGVNDMLEASGGSRTVAAVFGFSCFCSSIPSHHASSPFL